MSWERPTAFETTQIGVEVTPGTKVPATKRLLCTSFMFDPQNIGAEPYTPQGFLVPTTGSKRKEFTQGTYEGRACFNDLCYLLSGLFGAATITTPGGATNTRRWTWKPRSSGPNVPKTFSVEKGQGVSGLAEAVQNLLIQSLTMRLTQEEASVNGGILATEPDYEARMSTNEVQEVDLDGATGGTFTLTYSGQATGALAFNISASALQTALEGLSTIGAGNVEVTAVSAGVYSVEFIGTLSQTNASTLVIGAGSLTGSGGSAAVTTTTAGVAPTDIPERTFDTDRISIWTGPDVAGLQRLLRVQEVELVIPERYTAQFNHDDQQPSFSTHVEKAIVPSASVVMQRDADAKALIPYLQAKTTRTWRFKVRGPEIESGFEYTFTVTFTEKGRGVGHGDAQDVATGAFDLFMVHDSTFGGFVEFVIDTDLAGL